MSIVKPNCFEKTKEAWGIFSFFSSTNVETKNVCPIAYNVLRLCVRLRSVGIERSGSLHKTAVISWLRIINDKLKLK